MTLRRQPVKITRALFLVVAILLAGSAIAQVTQISSLDSGSASAAITGSSAATPASATDNGPFALLPCPTPKIQHLRPASQCGVNVFEPPKEDAAKIPFSELKLDWGVAFSQTYQSLKHHNSAQPNIVGGVNTNQPISIGRGFDLAGANLYLNGQIADGVRLGLTMYLSSRHHNEVWVKDGYILIDKLPFKLGIMHGLADGLFENVATLKIGHFEINYGDAHFRRSDNGQGMYNPFIGNYLLDAFTTEIGGELYLRAGGFLAMGSITGGEIKGNVLNAPNRRPAFITKIGFDRQVNPDLRVRLTASNYTIRKSPADTLFGGDRGGSPYFCVLESVSGCGTSQAFSGTINPGFSWRVMALQVNPFVKYKGLELFGVMEHATGRSITELVDREWNQVGGEAVYRFANDHLFVGARLDRAKGGLANSINQVSANRTQFAAGWFLNHYLLVKSEYVIQNYKNYPVTNILNGGRFQGFMGDAVLAF
jgi:hypothetical protein